MFSPLKGSRVRPGLMMTDTSRVERAAWYRVVDVALNEPHLRQAGLPGRMAAAVKIIRVAGPAPPPDVIRGCGSRSNRPGTGW